MKLHPLDMNLMYLTQQKSKVNWFFATFRMFTFTVKVHRLFILNPTICKTTNWKRLSSQLRTRERTIIMAYFSVIIIVV